MRGSFRVWMSSWIVVAVCACNGTPGGGSNSAGSGGASDSSAAASSGSDSTTSSGSSTGSSAGGTGSSSSAGSSSGGSGWVCDPGYRGANDGCDCGCGDIDPDCGGQGCGPTGCVAPGCEYCYDAQGVQLDTCPSSSSTSSSGGGVPAGWTCQASWATDQDCDCGCNAADPTCGSGGCSTPGCTASACDFCNDAAGDQFDCGNSGASSSSSSSGGLLPISEEPPVTWTTRTIDAFGVARTDNVALTVGNDGTMWITYRAESNTHQHVIQVIGDTWTDTSFQVPAALLEDTAIVTDSTGRPYITYNPNRDWDWADLNAFLWLDGNTWRWELMGSIDHAIDHHHSKSIAIGLNDVVHGVYFGFGDTTSSMMDGPGRVLTRAPMTQANATWSDVQFLNYNGVIKTAANGAVHCAWFNHRSGMTYFAHGILVGGQLMETVELPDNIHTYHRPRHNGFALDPQGRAHLVYTLDDATRELRHVTISGTNVNTERLVQDALYSALALDSQGNPSIFYMTYYDTTTTRVMDLHRLRKIGGTWRHSIVMPDAEGVVPFIDSTGRTHIIFRNLANGTEKLEYATTP